MSSFDYDLLCELTETSGVPGYEERIREIVRRELEPAVDSLHGDALGNVVGTLEGSGEYSVVVAAHMDEIGFMVRNITDDGFIQVGPLGGWDPRVLSAQRVTIHTEDEDIPGVIGATPPHIQDEEDRKSTPDVEDIHLDVGMDAEAVEERISVGDLVTLEQSTSRIGEHVSGKALDDRVGVFVMLEAARRIEDPAVTIHFVGTVQEEVGLRGAEAAGVDLDPDLAIALDVTLANDTPAEVEEVTQLGEGTAIKLKDRSVITNHKVHRRLRDLAESNDIPYQLEIMPGGGTDTAMFQRVSGATPVGAISIPTRYVHTVTESAHVADIAASIDLLEAFLASETGDNDYML